MQDQEYPTMLLVKASDLHLNSSVESFNGGQHSLKDVKMHPTKPSSLTTLTTSQEKTEFMSPDGVFTVKKGIPDDNPVLPDPISNSMNIANVSSHIPV